MWTELEESFGWNRLQILPGTESDNVWNDGDDDHEISLLRDLDDEKNKNIVKDSWVVFFKRSTLRTLLVVLTVCIAVLIPFFGLLMELVGAMCLTMMVFVLPVVFSFQLWGHKMTMAQKVFGIFIVAVGSIGGLIGTVQALSDIAASLKAGKHD